MLSNGRLITAVYIQWVWTPSSKMVLCRPTSESLFFLGISTFLYNLIYTADTARSGHASITGIDVLLELVQLPSIGSFQLLWRGWAERRPADVLIRCLIPIRYGLVLPWGFTVCGRLPTHTYTKHTHTHTALSTASFYRADAMLLRKSPRSVSKGLLLVELLWRGSSPVNQPTANKQQQTWGLFQQQWKKGPTPSQLPQSTEVLSVNVWLKLLSTIL